MSNKIQYRRVGDYYIPNLIIPPEEANVTLGKWGVLANVTISLKRGFIYQFQPYYHPALLPYPLTF